MTLPALAQAEDYTYTTNNGAITITGYTGPGGDVTIPDTINGLPVTSIGDSAFLNKFSLTSVTIPNSITNLGIFAFHTCTNLTCVKIGTNVANIGNAAFSSCTSLTNVTIPDSVTRVGIESFAFCSGLTSVTIGNSVPSIADWAFALCTSLTGVYFRGNAPSIDSSTFYGDNNMTVYYLPGTAGWGPTFGGRPTALWLPQMQTTDASFGVRTNQFGFNVTWASGQVVVVEGCTNLANPIWSPLQTNTLTSDPFYFSDPQWTNYFGRFYRLRSP